MKIGSFALSLVAAMAWSGAGTAQSITSTELEGSRIEGVVVQNRVVRNAEGKTGPNRTTLKFLVNLLPDGKVRSVSTVTVTKLKTGETSTRSFPSDGVLGKPEKFRDGSAVWVFQDESLVRLRTQQEGGLLIRIAFARTEEGLSCKLTSSFAREEGVGKLSSASGVGTAHVVILSVKEVSSSCRIVRP